jgi:nitroreductase
MSARPSNRQHWDFVVVTDPDQLRALSAVWRGAGHIAGAPPSSRWSSPRPTTTAPRLIDYYDLGQATYAMMLAAADLGIGYPPTARCAPSPSRTAARWAR